MNFRLLAFLTFALLLGSPRAHGFALNGPPNASYQVAALNYDGTLAPQVLGEEYRWNVPILTYGFDSAFINYFGTNGIRAIEAAFRQMNDLPAVSLITDQVLTNTFPLNSQGNNPAAAALFMTDIRSRMLTILVEFMGLSDAERFTWCLRNRWVDAIPSTNYVVIQRNYDPITRTPTDTVNGQKLGYTVLDGPPADAYEIDPAGGGGFFIGLIQGRSVSSVLSWSVGTSFSSLTYDDVGGLRYLYATNNFNVENLLPTVAVTSTAASAATGSPWSPVGVTNILTVVGSGAVNTALRGGIDKVSFVRVDFDSLLGFGFAGVTNTWTDRYVAPSSQTATIQQQTLARSIVRPDIIISARDLGLAANLPIEITRVTGNYVNHDGINGLAGQNGPGVLTVPFQLRVDFTTQFPYYIDGPRLIGPPPIGGGFGGGFGNLQYSGVWGWFDDTTIYKTFPDFLNLQFSDLERMVLEARTLIK